jgi:hypothetical protein
MRIVQVESNSSLPALLPKAVLVRKVIASRNIANAIQAS